VTTTQEKKGRTTERATENWIRLCTGKKISEEDIFTVDYGNASSRMSEETVKFFIFSDMMDNDFMFLEIQEQHNP